MAKKVQARGCASIVFVFVLLCRAFKGGSAEVLVSLEMPRFAARGSSVALHCAHNVQPDLLYKVEWRRAGGKLVQYVRGRNPPFRSYPTPGARLNLSQANEDSIILHNLEFSASGSYSCEVSLETPIYTKSSIDRDLLVIQPQVENPRINFGASIYTAGDTLEASCTTSHAHPAPHITWLINGEKVDVSLVRSDTRPVMHKRHNQMALRSAKIIPKYPTLSPSTAFPGPATTEHPTTVRIFCSSKDIHGPSQIQKPAKKPQQVDESLTIPSLSTNRRMGEESLSRSITKLRVAVSALRLAAGGRLALTCLSTIPAYRGPAGRYADSRNHTVMVGTLPDGRAEPDALHAKLHATASKQGLAVAPGNYRKTITKALLVDVVIAEEIDPSTTTDISSTNSAKVTTSNFLLSLAVTSVFRCLVGKFIKFTYH